MYLKVIFNAKPNTRCESFFLLAWCGGRFRLPPLSRWVQGSWGKRTGVVLPAGYVILVILQIFNANLICLLPVPIVLLSVYFMSGRWFGWWSCFDGSFVLHFSQSGRCSLFLFRLPSLLILVIVLHLNYLINYNSDFFVF